MGTSYGFICEKCGYRTQVCAGKDFGFVAVLETKVCTSCKEIVDVWIGREGVEGPTGNPEYDKRLNVCPSCGSADLEDWTEETPCPKCGGVISEDPSTGPVLWD